METGVGYPSVHEIRLVYKPFTSKGPEGSVSLLCLLVDPTDGITPSYSQFGRPWVTVIDSTRSPCFPRNSSVGKERKTLRVSTLIGIGPKYVDDQQYFSHNDETIIVSEKKLKNYTVNRS